MNFTASLRLNSSQFKKGIADVQRSLKSLQSSFLSLAGALGLGLSLNRLGSSLMDTATKMSTAKNVLENVSKEIGEYGENLQWLRKISNEYGQDLATLINSFAQFRAAAASSNLTLEQMRDVYESLTRAAGAFHMDSKRTNDMMMAVTQMLSKGKVAAEELRRQLGNALPGAFNLMAEAAYNAGIITENSTAELEKAMKDGRVMAEQVLPAFAKVLNDVTENANFESLQSSINRLKNTWVEIVEAGRFENLYKGIIDGANGVLKFFSEGFWPKILGGISGVASAIMMPKAFKKFMTGAKDISAAAQVEFEKILTSAKSLDEKLDKMKEPVKGMRIEKGAAKWRNSTMQGNYGYYKPTKYEYDNLKYAGVNVNEFKKTVAELNDEILKLNRASRDAGVGKLISNKDAKALAEYNAQLKSTIKKAYEAPKSSIEATTTGVKGLNVAFNGLVGVLKKVGAAFKAAFSALAIGAIIGGITYLVGKLVEARKEAKRIAGIADNMVDTVNKAGGENNKTLIQLTQIKKALEGINGETDKNKKVQLINEVNKALGLSGDKLLTIEDDIQNKVIPAIDKYIGKIKEAAKQQAILANISSATSRVIQLEAENEGYRQDENYGKKQTYQTGSIYSPIGGPVSEGELLTVEAQKLQGKIDKNNREIAELNKGIDLILKGASEETLAALYSGKDTIDIPGHGGPDTAGTKDTKATPQKALDDYKEELKKLDNQYKAGSILASDYKKRVEALNQKAFEELSAFGWDDALKGLKNSGDKALAEELRQLATSKLLEGLNDPEEIEKFDRAIADEAESAYNKFKEAWERFLEWRKKKPVLGTVDDEDGYMYSKRKEKGKTYTEYEIHFNEETLQNFKNYVSDLESYINDLKAAMSEITDPAEMEGLNRLLGEAVLKLQLAQIAVKDLKTKANVAQIESEIAELKKQGIESIFSSVTNLSGGMDRLYRAYQSIMQINDSTWKSEELENFLTVVNALIQAFEVMKSIISAVSAAEEIYTKIKEKDSMKAIALNQAVAASEVAKATAAGGAAAAGAASATAAIPIIGPALAIGAVAAVVAAIIAGMKKFATGGYVGGNSYTGDKQLARVNSGELILNPSQQRNLLNLANGKGSGGGQVEFKIRGADLVGTLKNYDRIKKG